MQTNNEPTITDDAHAACSLFPFLAQSRGAAFTVDCCPDSVVEAAVAAPAAQVSPPQCVVEPASVASKSAERLK